MIVIFIGLPVLFIYLGITNFAPISILGSETIDISDLIKGLDTGIPIYIFRIGFIAVGVICLAIYLLIFWLIFFRKKRKHKLPKVKNLPFSVSLYTVKGQLTINNPFRDIFVIGSAGSGKKNRLSYY